MLSVSCSKEIVHPDVAGLHTDPRNSEIAMEMAADRYRFVLDRDMVVEPGEK
jgi:hypothetical protein